MDRITDIVVGKGGIVTLDNVDGRSEYIRMLRAVSRGELVRVKHGVYAEFTSMLNTMVDIEKIVPRGVVCLYNAWSYYELTTVIPPAFCVAIESKRKVTLPDCIPVRLYYWKSEYLTLGVVETEISGYRVSITDIERSVCDAVKYRNKVGLEVCAEVVRSYLRRDNRNISKLMEYAKKLRVAKVLSNYLEIGTV